MLCQVIVTYSWDNSLRGIVAPKSGLHCLLLKKHYGCFRSLPEICGLPSSLLRSLPSLTSVLPIVYSITAS